MIFLYSLGTELSGYIIGVAYINSCVPKLTKKLKSLYLVVRDEIIIPNPKPKRAIIRTNKGKNDIV